MLLHLIRNAPKGKAITGRLVIKGRWFCDTLERVGYQIPALCYPVRVTQSPKFRRLLPLVGNVPRRSGIRLHRGTKPEHSTGCILVVADNKNNINNFRSHQLPRATGNTTGRNTAEVEKELTRLILKAQEEHEEIILEVTDFRPGTEYGYNTPCDTILQEHKRNAHRAELRYLELHPEERQS